MTRKSRKNQRRVIASLLTGVFMIQQTMTLTVVASEISGITGNNGVYNIDPSSTNGNVGFRHYEKFNLDQGDVANLNYADISTFVNMVDNKINVNGIVNSVKNGNFYGGKAVFVSPNGMVVGASGVINVGSLGVYTPITAKYDQLVKNPNEANLTTVMNSNRGAEITINGTVLTAGDVDLRGGQVTVGQNAGIIGGINESQMSAISTNEQATTLFNNLVNTNNLNTGNSFASSQDGQILIKSNQGTDIQGTVKNFATGTNSQTKIMNYGPNGINISGTVANANGTLKVNNNYGDVNISGNLKNNGTTQIFNVPSNSTAIYTQDGVEHTVTMDTNTGMNITGNIDTNGTLTINNTGEKGMTIAGNINHTGDSSVQNGYLANSKNTTGAMNIGGTFNTSGNATFTNTADGVGGMNITGNVTTGGKATYTNNGEGGLNVQQAGNIKSANGLEMLHTGAGGLNINGTADNTGIATVTNKAGNLNVGGSFTNKGTATMLNDGNAFNVSGTVNNNDGTLDMTNNGEGGFTVSKTGAVNGDSSTITMTNNKGYFNIDGSVTGKGEDNVGINDMDEVTPAKAKAITLTNNGSGFNINGTVTQKGGSVGSTQADVLPESYVQSFVADDTNIVNNSGDLNINGTVSAKNVQTNTNITNKGNALNIGKTGNVTTSGNFSNDNGKYIFNEYTGNAQEVENYKYLTTGKTTVTNNAGELKVNGNVNVNNSDLTMTNNGTNFTVNGNIAGKNSYVNLNNNNGALDINSTGKVDATYTDKDVTPLWNDKSDINITNKGNGGVNVKGLINAENNVNIKSTDSNVVIGDNTANNNYVTAGKNIDIAINNGSLLNYGVEKVLLNAGGDLNMDVTDGTIGLEVGGGCQGAACTGIGPKSGGSRDFTKSVNANVKGKVNAVTTKATKPEDLVINYAAIDSDMNIDSIKADGRVILTVDDDYGKNNTGARYNMVNDSTDKSKANVEGKGISLISNGNIGSNDNKLTFNQTTTNGYSMDVLANE